MGDEKSFLSVSDICAIIKACGENGVSRLTYGGLALKLGGQTARLALDNPDPAPWSEPASIEAIQKIQDKEADRAFVDEETQLKEEQLRQMLIEDPSGLEKLINLMHLQGDSVENESERTEEEA